MTPTTLATKVAETDPVRLWRLQALIGAGYPPLDALVLSGRGDVDLHVATRLVERGCPATIALRILL